MTLIGSLSRAMAAMPWVTAAPPDMPPFKSKLTKDEAWTLVEFHKDLRKPS